MRYLILTKHSLPEIDPAVPAAEWRLSEEGRRRCEPLAERLAAYRPWIVVSSIEPKARETAAIVAGRLRVPCETAAGLHEHDRRGVGFMSPPVFEASMAAFFARPAELVLGGETATQAQDRFSSAVTAVLAGHSDGDIVVVAHGTVISLYVAPRVGVAPFDLWRRLGLPSFLVLSLPDLTLMQMVETMDDGLAQQGRSVLSGPSSRR